MEIVVGVISVLGLGVLLWWVRRHFRAWMSQNSDVTGAGFTLADLRDLHRKGHMSDEEFERAKAKIVQGYTVAAQKSAKPENPAASSTPKQPPPT
jgi:uncharacterized membrane protein